MPPALVRFLLLASLAPLLLVGCASPTASVRDRLREVSAAFPHWSSANPAPAPAARRSPSATDAKLALSNTQLKVEHLELQIEEALRNNNTPHAAALCEDLLELDSRSVFAHHHLAVFADQQARYADAEQHYLAALDVEPRNADLLSSLGWSYLLQGRSSEALQVLQQALVHHPGHATAIFNLGWLAGLQGDDSRAIAYFRRQVSDVEAEQLLNKVRSEARERHLTDRSSTPLQAPDPRVARAGTPPTPPTATPLPQDESPRVATRTVAPQPRTTETTADAVEPESDATDRDAPDRDTPVTAEVESADLLAVVHPDDATPAAVTPAEWQPPPATSASPDVQLVENLHPEATPRPLNHQPATSTEPVASTSATPAPQPVTTARYPQPASSANPANPHPANPGTLNPATPNPGTSSTGPASQPRASLTPELTMDEVWQIGRTLLGPAERTAEPPAPRSLAPRSLAPRALAPRALAPRALAPRPAAPSAASASAGTDRPAHGAPIPTAAHRRALQRGLELGLP